MAGKRWKNTYQVVSLVILTTKGNLGHRNQGLLGKNKTPKSHIVATTFILQHITIGFGMSSKFSFTHNTLFLCNYQRQQTYFKSYFNSSNHHQNTSSPLVDQIPQQPALRATELGTGEATARAEEILEDEAESCEDKCTFLSSFHFMPDDFDIDSHNSDFDTLRN